MNINITTRGFSTDQNLNDFIHDKLQRLTKFDKNISNIKVVLLKESRAEKVELIVESNKKTYLVVACRWQSSQAVVEHKRVQKNVDVICL